MGQNKTIINKAGSTITTGSFKSPSGAGYLNPEQATKFIQQTPWWRDSSSYETFKDWRD